MTNFHKRSMRIATIIALSALALATAGIFGATLIATLGLDYSSPGVVAPLGQYEFLATFAAVLIATFTFIAWAARAYRNLPWLGAVNLPVPPGSPRVVLYFFLPIAWVIWPVWIMFTIARHTSPRVRYRFGVAIWFILDLIGSITIAMADPLIGAVIVALAAGVIGWVMMAVSHLQDSSADNLVPASTDNGQMSPLPYIDPTTGMMWTSDRQYWWNGSQWISASVKPSSKSVGGIIAIVFGALLLFSGLLNIATLSASDGSTTGAVFGPIVMGVPLLIFGWRLKVRASRLARAVNNVVQAQSEPPAVPL